MESAARGVGSGGQPKGRNLTALYAAALARDNDGTITASTAAKTAKSGRPGFAPDPSAVIFECGAIRRDISC